MFSRNTTLNVAFILFAFAGIVLADAAFAVTFEKACADAVPLELDSTWRGYAAENETLYFRLEIPTPGIAAVEVAAIGSSEASPRLGFLGRGCAQPGAARDFAAVERSASHRVIAFRAPGTYFFRLGSQDPRQELGELKLAASFVAAEVFEEEHDLELGGTRGRMLASRTDFYVDPSDQKTDEQEVDPNPKGRGYGSDPTLSLITLEADSRYKTDEQEVDPNPKTDEQEVDPNPKGFDPAQGSIRAQLVLFGDGGWVSAKTDEQEVDPNPKTDEQEVDPNPKTEGARILTSLVTTYASAAKTDEQEVDPNPKTDEQEVDPNPKTDEQEVDPNPKAASRELTSRVATFHASDLPAGYGYGQEAADRQELLRWLTGLVWSDPAAASRRSGGRYRLLSYARAADAPAPRLALGGLCRRGELDDHADAFRCATQLALGRAVQRTGVAGEIGNGWGDDADVFSFTLDRLQTVTIETAGTVATLDGLYDRYGQRLAASGHDARGASARLVKTLPPGRYFIRIAGAHRADGTYDLAVAARDW